MRRSLLTSRPFSAPPPVQTVVIGSEGGDGQGDSMLSGQYVFSIYPSSGSAHLHETFADFQSGSGVVQLAIIDDGWGLVHWISYDTGQGGPDWDIDILGTWYVGVWVPSSGFMIAGGLGLHTATGGHPAPSSLGLGNTPPGLQYGEDSPAVVGYGFTT